MKKVIGYLLGAGAFILINIGLAIGAGMFLLLKLMEFMGFVL